MELKEKIKFEKWLSNNNWEWVVGLLMFFNATSKELKTKNEILELYNKKN